MRPFVLKTGLDQALLDADDRLPRICALFKDRCETLVDLAGWVRLFYVDAFDRNAEDLAKHVTDAVAHHPGRLRRRHRLGGVEQGSHCCPDQG
ncbi:MAG: hypothetical protein PBV86_18530, partial [Delftia lacustris]